MGDMLSGSQFTIAVTCPGCGQRGIEVWEQDRTPGARGRENQFVGRSGEFYERLRKGSNSEIEVVCKRCGRAISLAGRTLAAQSKPAIQ